MSKPSKSPRFFCETCNTEVPRNAKKCPGCGRYFASVRCPACGFIGEEDLFRGGCPVCGYSSMSQDSISESSRDFPKRKAGHLPIWVYILTAAAFTAVLAALLFRIF